MEETLEQVTEQIASLHLDWLHEAEKTENKAAQRRSRVLSTKLCKLHKKYRELSKA